MESSSVAAVGYDAQAMVLEVAFNHGAVYQYSDVPEAVYRALVGADSVGRYLNAHVKGSYAFVRVE